MSALPQAAVQGVQIINVAEGGELFVLVPSTDPFEE
jgi:hypothetical protein